MNLQVAYSAENLAAEQLVWDYSWCNIQQNSINPTCTEQAPNCRIFQTIRWYLYWPKFLQVIFCYCCHTLAIQLSREHLILLSPSSAGLRLSGSSSVLSGVFLAEEVEGTRRQRTRRYPAIVDVWTLLEAVLNMSLRFASFTAEVFKW